MVLPVSAFKRQLGSYIKRYGKTGTIKPVPTSGNNPFNPTANPSPRPPWCDKVALWPVTSARGGFPPEVAKLQLEIGDYVALLPFNALCDERGVRVAGSYTQWMLEVEGRTYKPKTEALDAGGLGVFWWIALSTPR